jgi:selenocysteine-specific elongation factor
MPHAPHAKGLPRQVVVGLAGHIDHGKSALVHQLTGAATDTRPEERQRGMTVDLGFTHFDEGSLRIALIDVPGHERFVHNMLTGAAAVRFGLLVVAADDSVMPQTREHLSIMHLLGIPGGIVVVTKTDLVDDEQLELVRLEIEELVAGTSFAEAPVIPVSNLDGSGIAEVRRALVELGEGQRGRGAEGKRGRGGNGNKGDGGDGGRQPLPSVPPSPCPPVPAADGPFRLSIDRAFSLAGHGTVVAGTVRRGSAEVGDALTLLPRGESVKIRRLQTQGQDAETVTAGERAALNLAGIKVSEVRRGDELVGGPAYAMPRRFLTSLEVLPLKRGIRNRELVRCHLGAREATARILLPTGEAEPGTTTVAVIDCREPMLGEFGQPVVLRRLSPEETIGGGRILACDWPRRVKLSRVFEIGREWISGASAETGEDSPVPSGQSLLARMRAFLELHGERSFDEENWSLALGADPAMLREAVETLVGQGVVRRIGTEPPLYVAGSRFRELCEALQRRFALELKRRHPQRLIPRAVLLRAFQRQASIALVEAAIDELIRQENFLARDDRIGLPQGVALSRRETELLKQLEADIVSGGTTPPTVKELAEHHGVPVKEVEELLQLAVDEGRLVRVSATILVTRQALSALVRQLQEFFQEQTTGTAAEFRNLWGITRKHAIPYLEYFDEIGITQRQGEHRQPGPRLLHEDSHETRPEERPP